MLDTYMSAFDLTILNLYRINGQEWPLLPGLLAQNPPKKLARGRDQDRLLVYLTMAGNVSYSNSEYEQIVGQVAETFYDTAGSLTFALKTAAEALNTYLVDRNMKSTGKGLYSTGSLVLCSLRGDSMYIVQCGPTHVYHLSGDSQHLNNPQLAGKGLGLSQTAHLYFAHITLAPGDSLLLCASLPPNWDKSLSEARSSAALDITRRRLLAITNTDVGALLVKVSEGSGAMNIIRAVKDAPLQPAEPAALVEPEALPASQPLPIPVPVSSALAVTLQSPPDAAQEKPPAVEPVVIEPAAESVPAGDGAPEASEPAPQSSPSAPESVETAKIDTLADQNPVETIPALTTEPSLPENTTTPLLQPAADEQVQVPVPVRTTRKTQASTSPQIRAGVINSLRAAARSLALFIQRGRALTQKFTALGEKNIARLLPGDDEDQQDSLFSRSWPLFIAIAIPVLLVVAARVVYFQLGYKAQYEIYFNRANLAASQTLVDSNPTTQRVQWQETLGWLDKADLYQTTSSAESQQLRQQAQSALDGLDRVVRVEFSPAFDLSTFPKNLLITRMIASDSDIYMLDNLTGVVIRGMYNNHNFTLDGSFKCGSGNWDGIQVGKLIDIIILPRSNPKAATILGIDASGNLLYCIPGKPPTTSFLQIPDKGWMGITAIAYDTYNSLYVLDAAGHAVWMYYGDAEFEFRDKPFFYFQDQVPVMMEQAIGMAINGDDLYLLHQDGHMTTCTFSRLDVSPTRCNDPAVYIDPRPGYQGGMRLGDTVFSQITFTSAPDPSVALLEPEPRSQAVYRFGARSLELQNQIRAGTSKNDHLPKGAVITAMALSPNKILFFAVNGQIFFAQNVP